MEHAAPCFVFFQDERGLWQSNTASTSIFTGAMNAIRHFNDWYGPRPGINAILEIHAGWLNKQKIYRVRARRVVEHFGLNPKDWLDG